MGIPIIRRESDTGQVEIGDRSALPENPLVSVHMITYNHGAYLARAIEGVIAQKTKFPIELIIGEDCSTDSTRQIALEYQRRYPHLIRVIYSDRNVGMHANFYRTLNRCRGSLVAICEGDDYWVKPEKLQQQAEYLETHPDYGATHGDINYLARCFGRWRQRDAIKRTSGINIPEGFIFEQVSKRMFVHSCTLCYRKEAITQFFESHYAKKEYAVLDWPLMIFVSRYHKVHYMDDVLAIYRRTPGSVMNSGFASMLQRVLDSRKISEDFRSLANKEIPWEADQERSFYRSVYTIAFYAGNEQQFRIAQEWLLKNDSAYFNSFKRMAMRLLFHWRPVAYMMGRWIALRTDLAYWRSSKYSDAS